jgi:hypothetical protein
MRLEGTSQQHSVIVEGLNNLGQLIIRDPAQGDKYLMTMEEFRAWWGGFGAYYIP